MAARIYPLRYACLTLIGIGLGAVPSSAQITPSGLGTRVNGSVFGRCSVGSCAIQGGVRSGANLFHRFGSFDTRHGITDVKLETRGQGNVILGVAGPAGFFLNTPLRLTSPANLFLLSPRGIWLGTGASFANVPNLLLSPSFALRIGSERFDLSASSPSDLSGFNADPAAPWEKLSEAGLAFSGDATITLEGGLINVDRNLVIDAGPGSIRATGVAPTTLHAGQSIRLSGGVVDLRGVALAADRGGNQLGTIALAAPSGDLRLASSQLLGRQLSLTGGEVTVQHSEFLAPDGTIVVRADTDLQLVNSQLDVSRSNAFPPNPDGDFDLPPAIALAAGGRLNLQESRLNASMGVPTTGGSPSARRSSGLAVLKATQAMTLASSSIVVDGSTSPAGSIVMVVDGEKGAEGIRINDSRISASYGMGGGTININSSSGIALSSSAVVASVDRMPLINGNAFGMLEGEEQSRPYGFKGGQIMLINSSTSAPISLSNTQVLALQTNSGGGFADSLLTIEPGAESGFYGTDLTNPAFSLGYFSGFNGGKIVISPGEAWPSATAP